MSETNDDFQNRMMGKIMREKQPRGPDRRALEHYTAMNELAKAQERLQIALGALADIAKSSDMTLSLARKKALRIYNEINCAAREALEGKHGR